MSQETQRIDAIFHGHFVFNSVSVFFQEGLLSLGEFASLAGFQVGIMNAYLGGTSLAEYVLLCLLTLMSTSMLGLATSTALGLPLPGTSLGLTPDGYYNPEGYGPKDQGRLVSLSSSQ